MVRLAEVAQASFYNFFTISTATWYHFLFYTSPSMCNSENIH